MKNRRRRWRMFRRADNEDEKDRQFATTLAHGLDVLAMFYCLGVDARKRRDIASRTGFVRDQRFRA